MGFLSKLLGKTVPNTPEMFRNVSRGTDARLSGSTPGPAVVNAGMGNYFEALRQSKDRTQPPYMAAATASGRIFGGLNRKQLAALGRYLVDNGGYPSYAVNQIAHYSVPVYPQAASPDPTWNKAAEEWFADWSKRADFTRRFDFATLQRLACKAIDTDGDTGVALTLKAGFPQLRFYDCFQIGSIKGVDPNDGVRVDADGVLSGYQVIEGKTERVLSVNEMALLYDPDRFACYRGFSPFRRGSNDIRDSADIKAFEKLAVKIASALAAVIEQDGPIEENVWGNDTGEGGNSPAPDDATATPQEKKLSLAELLGGDIPVVSGKLTQLKNERPHANIVNFLDYLAGSFVAGLDLPPAFFLDEKLTGPNIRAVLGKAQRKFDQRKAIIARLVEWVWVRVIGWAIDSGELPPADRWWKLTFQFPSRITIDLGDQMSNEREDVAVALMTRQERFGNRGLDWMRETDQSFAEDDYIIANAKLLAAKHGVPVEAILARYGFQTKPKPEAKPETKTTASE